MQQCNSESTCVRLRQLWTNELQEILGARRTVEGTQLSNLQMYYVRFRGPLYTLGNPRFTFSVEGLAVQLSSTALGENIGWAMMAHLGSKTHFTSLGYDIEIHANAKSLYS